MFLDYNGTEIVVTYAPPNEIPRTIPPELRARYLDPWVPTTRDAWLQSRALGEANIRECPVCHQITISYNKLNARVSQAFQERFGLEGKNSLFGLTGLMVSEVFCRNGTPDTWGIIQIQNKKVSPTSLYFASKDWRI